MSELAGTIRATVVQVYKARKERKHKYEIIANTGKHEMMFQVFKKVEYKVVGLKPGDLVEITFKCKTSTSSTGFTYNNIYLEDIINY